MKTMILLAAVAILTAHTALHAEDRIIEMLKSDLRAERAVVVKEEMQFTPQEAAAFWPVYEKYENEIRKINDQRLELNKMYADNYANMTDGLAERLARKSLELDIKEAYVRKEYFREFNHVLSPVRAVKFFQLDSLMGLLVRTKVAAEPPFIE